MRAIRFLPLLGAAILLGCSEGGSDATGPSGFDLSGSWVGAYTASVDPGATYTADVSLDQSGEDLTGNLATDAPRLANLAGSLSGSDFDGLMAFTDGCSGTASFTSNVLNGGNRIQGTYEASDCLGQYTGTFDLVRGSSNPPQASPDSSGGPPPPAGSFALSFDGGDGTETPDSDGLDLTDTFTFEGWIKPTDPTGSGGQTILAKWGLSVSASYGVGIGSDGHLHLVTHTPGASPNNTKLFSSEVLPAGVWTHFAYVFDHGATLLYLNGALDASCGGSTGTNCWDANAGTQTVPNMNTPQVTSSLVAFGRQKSPEGFIGNYFKGEVDELRFWNVVRTQAQIASGREGVAPTSPGLVAYWRMEEGSGDVAADLTGNGHDMRLGGSAGADAADPAWVSASH